ncbi:LacI family DNA-binding transcriptional regulator [Cellulomonas carbonis]|uniref:LacI family transcriptional regulator n=1 Tax=Cellulomonas carbonis T26 TaxID=947969 RepID=A0A0A0BMY5_9CELL|nr:LacI family DNA-binding transcriptional regulator [Cellulomonas carbonis]KGM09311.1 LacI family transcriptional regulator [Cellulomonas carbonis T26]GGC13299.1 LacI family transcriptional regulator [Cellulomonas carbonis]
MGKVTLQTVADRVGVSRMTVSNAFSRPDQLSAALRERVLAAAAELGYVGPDPAARGLARGEVGAVGLLTGSLRHAFTDEISTRFLGAIAEELAPTGLALTLLPASGDAPGEAGPAPEPSGSLPRSGTTRAPLAAGAPAGSVALDAAIVYSCDPTSPAVELLTRRRLPLVHVDQPPADGVTSVNVDDHGGAHSAARHLLGLGHRRVALVTTGLPAALTRGRAIVEAPPAELLAATTAHAPHERLRGWLDALAEAGVAPVVAHQPDSYVPTEEPARALMALDEPPTAVLCFSDAVADGVLRTARTLGLRVPEDLSVVGFDDNVLATRTEPGLTTVRQDVREKGRVAVGALLEAIDARRAGRPPEVGSTLLPTVLVVRATTAPPPDPSRRTA